MLLWETTRTLSYNCPPLSLQDDSDSIADTESDRAGELKGELSGGGGGGGGGAINLSSRPNSAHTTPASLGPNPDTESAEVRPTLQSIFHLCVPKKDLAKPHF